MKAITFLITMFTFFTASAQISVYDGTTLVDHSQPYGYTYPGTNNNNYLQLEIQNDSQDTMSMRIDVCVIDDSPDWQLAVLQWGHEDDQFGGIHANVALDTVECYYMTAGGWIIQASPGQRGIMRSDFITTGTSCEHYRYYVKHNATVVDSFDVIACSTLSLEEHESRHIAVFPNPVENRLHVTSDDPIDNVAVFDALGRRVVTVQVEQEFEIQLTLSDLAPGSYYAQVGFSDGSLESRKFMKQ